MSVSLSEVLAGAEAQAVPLSAECAGYLVLAAADQAALSPRRVQPGEVCLLDDGAVRLLGGVPADDATAEGDLRELLGGLLSSASSTTAGLMRARRRAAGAGVGALLRELERALIPVNRAAARRALARLARETERAKDEGKISLVPPAPVTVAVPPPVQSAEPPHVHASPVVAMPVVAAPVVASPEPAPVAVDADPGITQLLPRAEVTERLAPPAPAQVAAPVPEPVLVEPPVSAPVVAPKEESETRPEPVVLRASQRPPAMPEPLSVVPPPVRDLAPTGDTPVLGTVLAPTPAADEPIPAANEPSSPAVELAPPPAAEEAPPLSRAALASSLVADEPRLSVAELAQALATPVPPEDDELELDIEVTFSAEESTIVPEDVELILLAADGAELERTEPCPSPAESMLPPPVAAVAELELPDDVLASAPDASPPEEAPEPGTVLPPWVTARPEQEEPSPPPRVVVPRPRESNVDELLERMSSEAADVDALRSGLKSLAGLEPTPPPPGALGD